jgi:hypothetical protein
LGQAVEGVVVAENAGAALVGQPHQVVCR